MDTLILIHKLLGTKYVFWDGREWSSNNKGPFYVSKDKNINLNYIRNNGCNCAGFINLLFRNKCIEIPDFDSDYPGGTYAYGFGCKWERYKKNNNYPKYSLLLKPYIEGEDEGHIALVLENNKMAHCYPIKGIIIEDIKHDMFEYICTEYSDKL